MLGRERHAGRVGLGSRRDANTQKQTLSSRRGAMAMQGVTREISGIEKRADDRERVAAVKHCATAERAGAVLGRMR